MIDEPDGHHLPHCRGRFYLGLDASVGEKQRKEILRIARQFSKEAGKSGVSLTTADVRLPDDSSLLTDLNNTKAPMFSKIRGQPTRIKIGMSPTCTSRMKINLDILDTGRCRHRRWFGNKIVHALLFNAIAPTSQVRVHCQMISIAWSGKKETPDCQSMQSKSPSCTACMRWITFSRIHYTETHSKNTPNT